MQMREYCESISSHRLPKWNEISDIGLYIDQVLYLIQQYIGPYVPQEELLTASMINNYVKTDVLPASVKKKYSREHIARLMFICLMKRQLSIPTISAIMNERISHFGIEHFYNSFTEMYESFFIRRAESLLTKNDALSFALELAVCGSVDHAMAETLVKQNISETTKKKKQ